MALLACFAGSVAALELALPTANDALLRGQDAEFFQPTVEGTVGSGMFGCVRRNGSRFHEGIDIKCLHRDRRGEPMDTVRAAAAGTVAFINPKPGLSNYGRYVILEHRWDGVEVFTLYAHLREIAAGLTVGQPVAKGQPVGVLGRSANTREGISRDRAHLHFEINFMLNPHFGVWYPRRDPHAPPFGNFNGLNFVGLDPAALLRAAAADPQLNFADYIARQPIAFTVLIAPRPIPWFSHHPEQVRPSGAEPVIAYEIGLTAWGLPVAVWPRGAADVSASASVNLSRGLPVLYRVNPAAIAQGNCVGLIQQRGGRWELTEKGRDRCELLTFQP